MLKDGPVRKGAIGQEIIKTLFVSIRAGRPFAAKSCFGVATNRPPSTMSRRVAGEMLGVQGFVQQKSPCEKPSQGLAFRWLTRIRTLTDRTKICSATVTP